MSDVKTVKLAFLRVQPENESEIDRSPIILHHGLSRSKERWKKLMQSLSNKTKRTVYAVDARNHGESEKSDFFTFDVLADDLANFLKVMSIPRAIVVGHSMGGIAAMKLALTKPELVELLIVEDISPKPLVQELCNVLAAIFDQQSECIKKLSTSTASEEAVQQQLRECIYRTIPMIPDSDHEALEKSNFSIYQTESGGYALRANMEVISNALLDSKSLVKPFVGNFHQPTLFIYGDQSQMEVGRNEETIFKLFPKASLHAVKGAAHEVFSFDPEEYEQQLIAFIEGKQ